MGFSGTIRRSKDALRRLRDLLELPSVAENPDKEAKRWREEARELCYDLEDAISVTTSASVDEHAPSAAKPAAAAGPPQATRSAALAAGSAAAARGSSRFGCRRAAEHGLWTLDKLKGRAMDALSEFNNLSLRQIECVDHIEDDEAGASFLVGMKDPTKEIIELLHLPDDDSDKLKGHKVVSIVGLLGSGKSTLAAQVHQNIAEKFHCTARVFVTQKPNVKGILIDLLRKLGGNGDNLEDLHELTLVRLVQEHVQDKRFLVLAEDVWDENTWMVIRCALSHNNSGGRTIMTTRINYIASFGDSVYRICPLNKENSKSLLLKNVQLSLPADTLDKILEKCGGLPLAIIAMSSVLKNVESAEHWEKLYNSKNSADTEDSIKSMRRKLSLGYYELSYHLRMCLLYLSIFPARREIKRKRLVRRWIAQGLVHAQHGQNVAEQATCYFNELINRNWIEPVKIKSDGQARACRVHNVILDFIVYKSAEENLVTILDSSSEIKRAYPGRMLTRKVRLQNSSSEIKEKNIHNLSIQNLDYFTKFGGAPHVRSLTIFGRVGSQNLDYYLQSDVLRVLDLEDCYPSVSILRDGIKSIADASSLLHLRYLSVGAAGINGLIEEVAKMRHLETLDLRKRKRSSRLPFFTEQPQPSVEGVRWLDITGLEQLVRLLVDSETTLKAKIKNMKALEEVKYISVSKHSEEFLKELGQLAKLRVLGIHLDAEETPDEQKKAMSLASSLHKLGNSELHSLYIDGSWDVSLNLTCDGDSRQPTLPSLQKLKFRKWCYVKEVPGWMASLENLEKLRLGISKMKQDQLAILGSLPCLVDLFLDILEVHGEKIRFEELMGFPYLKCLGICCRTRMEVKFEKKSLPCLEHLKLHIDVRDGVIPEGCEFVIGIEHVPSLTKFDALIYCVRETDPVVKHVKDALQKEASDSSITTELIEKEESNKGVMPTCQKIWEKVRNLGKDEVRKLESAQIDVEKLKGLFEDTRRFLMMLLDDENPKHQVVEWTITMRELLVATWRDIAELPSRNKYFPSPIPRSLPQRIEKMGTLLPNNKSSGSSRSSRSGPIWIHDAQKSPPAASRAKGISTRASRTSV